VSWHRWLWDTDGSNLSALHGAVVFYAEDIVDEAGDRIARHDQVYDLPIVDEVQSVRFPPGRRERERRWHNQGALAAHESHLHTKLGYNK
jgi:hypothetical protein